jgi:hypothetical protein
MSRFVVNNTALASFERRTFAELDRRLWNFGEQLLEYIAHLISIPVFPRSLPGEAPRKETGRLQAGMFLTHRTGGGINVGNTMPYARGLELGIHVAQRPYLQSSLYAMISVLQREIN